MAQPVKLSEILDGMEVQSEEMPTYLDKKTGQVISLSSEELTALEDGELPADELVCDDEMREYLSDLLDRQDDLLALPSQFDIHEHAIMQDFAASLTNGKQADALSRALQGRGAFRRFKDRIQELGVADQWYQFRAAAFKQLAIEWCEANELPYVDDRPQIGLRDSIETSGVKELYDGLVEQARALLDGERDFVANAANLAALLYHSLLDVNWAGWYFLREQQLVLGPFQGKPACSRIPLGKGVCGTAAAKRETLVVEDVHKFPGHIACDKASKAEIVIPVVRDGQLLGVLDLDSPLIGRFDADDRAGLERLVEVFLAASDDSHPYPSE